MTLALVPLKLSAFPNLPWVDQVAEPMAPTLPLPEASAADVPEPSLKASAATGDGPEVDWYVAR